MFATWKYDRDTSEVHNIRLAFDPISARSSQHQACDRCHEKKLKCSGDKDGCDRCISSSTRCEYNRCETKSSRKGKRGSRGSTDSSLYEGSPGRTSSQPGSPPKRVQKCSKSSQSGSRSRKSSSNTHLRSSTEPSDIEFSPRMSATTSITGSPYSMGSFAAVSENGDYSTTPAVSTAYGTPETTSTSPMPYHAEAFAQYSYPAGSWPASYPRDAVTTADLAAAYVATASNPQAFPILTPPDDYTQFQAYSTLPTTEADLWQYRCDMDDGKRMLRID